MQQTWSTENWRGQSPTAQESSNGTEGRGGGLESSSHAAIGRGGLGWYIFTTIRGRGFQNQWRWR